MCALKVVVEPVYREGRGEVVFSVCSPETSKSLYTSTRTVRRRPPLDMFGVGPMLEWRSYLHELAWAASEFLAWAEERGLVEVDLLDDAERPLGRYCVPTALGDEFARALGVACAADLRRRREEAGARRRVGGCR